MTSSDPSSTPNPDQCRVRPADSEEDAYFLAQQQHHYFGTANDWPKTLPLDYFPIAGRSIPDSSENEIPLDVYGVIAEQVSLETRQTVRIGGGVVLLYDRNDAIDTLPPVDGFPHAIVCDVNAFLLFTVVDPAWRGQGIGRKLLQDRLHWINSTNAEMVFTCGWERDSNGSSRPLLAAAGFSEKQTIEGFYADRGRPSCPDCGAWPSNNKECQCQTTVWMKYL